MIEIWAPKYSTNEVLIATHKVQEGINKIVFTKANHLKGKVYEIDSETIRKGKKQPNGKGYVYVVSMDEMKEVTRQPLGG